MASSIRELIARLVPDEQRIEKPFSDDVAQATAALLASQSNEHRENILGGWLRKSQPCIFGRAAAAKDLITFCLLDETFLSTSTDKRICEAIQSRRAAWQHQGEDGQTSAFVILAYGPRLFRAAPDPTLLELSLAILKQYLRRHVRADVIYQDQLRLWSLDFAERKRWKVGINFFGAQGDGRWWNDHRVPGGFGFSMNSVGHLVASEARRAAVRNAAQVPDIAGREARKTKALADLADLATTPVTSMTAALKYAMLTIRNASGGVDSLSRGDWPPATFLLRSGPDEKCPFQEVKDDVRIGNCNVGTYAGWYHTDITVPKEYFLPDITRPIQIATPFALDFQYLHAGRTRDHADLGAGRVERANTTIRKPEEDEDADMSKDVGFVPSQPISESADAIDEQGISLLVSELRHWLATRGNDVAALFDERPDLFRALVQLPELVAKEPALGELADAARSAAKAARTSAGHQEAFGLPQGSGKDERAWGFVQEEDD